MPHPLLLAAFSAAFASPEIMVGTAVLFLWGSLSNIEKIHGWVTGQAKQREKTDQEWKQKMEAGVARYVPEEVLEKRFKKLDDTVSLHAQGLHASQEQHNEHVRFRDLKVAELEHRLANIERDQRALENLPSRVQNLESKFEAVLDKMSIISESQAEMKADLKELVKAVAKMTP